MADLRLFQKPHVKVEITEKEDGMRKGFGSGTSSTFRFDSYQKEKKLKRLNDGGKGFR